jgi:flagellar hook-basal body complex protein FliE
MALTKVLTGGIADDAVGNTQLALDADYAFTGTVSGAGGISTATGTLPSEGGAATTVVAQGLAKAWVHGDTTASAADSFNVASSTDHGTGDFSYALSNAFSNANFSQTAAASSTDQRRNCTANPARVTTGIMACETSDANVMDNTRHCLTGHGDLA